MKRRNRTFELFSLSFLDLISCGFGAVVLLILISKTGEDVNNATLDEAQEILATITQLERNIGTLEREVTQRQGRIESQSKLLDSLEDERAALAEKKNAAASAEEKAEDDLEGLELVEETLNRASIRPQTNVKKRNDEVGGIPVDSDYILFIVDTSGSMQRIWNRVMAEMKNVLAIHPQVKGFQILNDNGIHLISSYNGKWIPDTASRRNNVFKAFAGWRSNSNSSPVEGLEVALKKYARPGIKLSIYIFGDDYTGGSYNNVIDRLQLLNTNKLNGTLLARIHAIGFISQGASGRFGVLMREVTKRNNGTFLALPKN
ncbi:MAG: hypothetical protein WDZ54_06110 [Sneathiella sp.]